MKINKNRFVVIADDDHDEQVLLSELVYMYPEQFMINCLNNGKMLMDYLYSGHVPDLLILDLNMPYMDGIQCLKEISAQKALKDLPVVVFTTSHNPDDIRKCFEYGAFLFYSKPWNADNCKAIVHKLLGTNWSNFVRPDTLEEFMLIAQGKEKTIF